MVRSGPPYAVDQRQVRSGGWLPDNLCSQEMRSERRIFMKTRTRVCDLCVRLVPPIALIFAVGIVSALMAHEATSGAPGLMSSDTVSEQTNSGDA